MLNQDRLYTFDYEHDGRTFQVAFYTSAVKYRPGFIAILALTLLVGYLFGIICCYAYAFVLYERRKRKNAIAAAAAKIQMPELNENQNQQEN